MIEIKKIQHRIEDIQSDLNAYGSLTTKDRTKLTKGDRRRIQELEVELQAILEPQARSELLVDQYMCARFFSVSVRSIQVWAQQKGCPRIKRGVYDLLAVFAWWQENINSGASEAEENVRLEYWRHKTRNEKLKADQTEGSLLKLDDACQAWANRLKAVWSGLYLLAVRLPPKLVGKSIREMQDIILEEVRLLNEAYARPGKFCKLKPKKEKAA